MSILSMSYPFPDDPTNYTTAAWQPFADAFDINGNTIAVDTGSAPNAQSPASVNISNTETALIQICGRYADRYASDLFINHAVMLSLLAPHDVTDGERYILMFGIRESGVDGNMFTACRLAETLTNPMSDIPTISHQYRKILAVVIEYKADPEYPVYIGCTVTLKDMTHSVFHLSKDFLESHEIKP